MSVELKYFVDKFDELMKARRASVGEIRVHSNGVKYQKQPDGSWKPLSKDGTKLEKEEGKFFGKNYSQFENKPKEAIDFLLKERNGQVIGAIEREGLGKIDIVYGSNGGGLCYIRNKHFVHADDFSSLDEMRDIIIDILKTGRIGEPYQDKRDGNLKRNIIKGYHKIVVKRTLVYDEEDNFKEKLWILTSYDTSRKEEDKLRKAVSEETALEKDQVIFIPNNSSVNSRKNHLERDQPSIDYSQCSLSLPKGTTNMNDMQQFVDEIIEKSKKGAPIGTERTWGGKVYIKAEKGWRPKSGAKKSGKEEETNKISSKTNDITSHASKASDEQLQAAIKDKDASPEIKQAAQEELNKRNPKEENNSNAGITDVLQRLLAAQEKGEIDLGEEVLGKIKDKLESQKQKKSESLTEETLDKKLDKLKEDITSKIDEKLNELNGFKKITQTYVKQDGKTIVIKMKGDNQYKASSPGFKLESKPYESLVDFKKRIKEEFNKQFSKIEDKEENNIQNQEKDKKTILNFKDKEEYKEYVLRRNSEKEKSNKRSNR